MINLKKGKYFKRQFENEEIEEISLNTKMLAIWGSPSAGKSTIAIKLAKKLSSQNKNVCLVFCDMTAPMMPCVALENEFEFKASIGSILSANNITDNLIKKNLTILKRNSYLALLGLLEEENEYSYPESTEEQIMILYEKLKNIFDYVIIDCTSYISNNMLSIVGLKMADNIIRIANQDAKSISYFVSQNSLFKNANIIDDKPIRILNNYENNVIEEVFANSDFKFISCEEIKEQFNERALLKNLSSKNGLIFDKEINKLCRRLF